MSKRVLPAPDRYVVCPQDGRVLPFYDETFEAASVILYPFMRSKSAALVEADGELGELSADELFSPDAVARKVMRPASRWAASRASAVRWAPMAPSSATSGVGQAAPRH